MCQQRFQAVELPFEGFLREEVMDVVVAGAADPGDSLLHFFAVELALVPLVGMAGLRDEMVPGKQALLPTAQFADAHSSHDAVRYSRILASGNSGNIYPPFTNKPELFAVPGVSLSGI
jgi:hypothetical protein